MSDKIRIAVVDDHPMLREGVVHVLSREDDFEVVATGSNAQESLAIAEQQLPDVMLLDMNMPGDGLDAVGRIAQSCPAVRVIMLTVREDHDAVSTALARGARAYVLKGIDGDELVNVVRSVHEGGSYVSPQLAARLLTNIKSEASHRTAAHANPIDLLTAREEEILNLIGEGLSNKEIAIRLDLKEKTIKHYVTNILQKLHARNRVEAAIIVSKQSSGS